PRPNSQLVAAGARTRSADGPEQGEARQEYLDQATRASSRRAGDLLADPGRPFDPTRASGSCSFPSWSRPREVPSGVSHRLPQWRFASRAGGRAPLEAPRLTSVQTRWPEMALIVMGVGMSVVAASNTDEILARLKDVFAAIDTMIGASA